MNFKIPTKQLKNALKTVAKIADKGPQGKASDSDCLIASWEGEGEERVGYITLESVNEGLYVCAKVRVDLEEEGSAIINRANLARVKFRGSDVHFTSKDNSLAFKCGSFSGQMAVSHDTAAVDEGRPDSPPALVYGAKAGLFTEALKYVLFDAVAEDDNFLKLRVAFSDNRLLLSAYDNYRATMYTRKIEGDDVEDGAIMMPGSLFQAVVSSVNPEDEIKIGFDDHLIRIRGGGLDVCHPVLQNLGEIHDIEGMFEDCKLAPPAAEATFDVGNMLGAISSIVSLAPSSDPTTGIKGTRVKIVPHDGKNKITAAIDVMGAKAKETFGVKTLTVHNDTIPLDVASQYIEGGLKMLPPGDCYVRMCEELLFFASEVGVMSRIPTIA